MVWIQIRLRDLFAGTRDAGEPLPAQYHRLFQIWFILGWPAFAGVIAIFVLMIAALARKAETARAASMPALPGSRGGWAERLRPEP